jgi:hypothetical protein
MDDGWKRRHKKNQTYLPQLTRRHRREAERFGVQRARERRAVEHDERIDLPCEVSSS